MSNTQGQTKKTDKSMKKKTSKTVRVDIKDWLYLYDMVGDEAPMKEAVRRCVEAHKELKEMEEIDLEDL